MGGLTRLPVCDSCSVRSSTRGRSAVDTICYLNECCSVVVNVASAQGADEDGPRGRTGGLEGVSEEVLEGCDESRCLSCQNKNDSE